MTRYENTQESITNKYQQYLIRKASIFKNPNLNFNNKKHKDTQE